MTAYRERRTKKSITRIIAILAVGAVALGGVLATAPAASADVPTTTAPLLQRTPDVATADALPTVQIDSGYVWAQTMIGNRVYAVGSFSNARAAGAAPGTSLTPRTNALSYDITNGNLLPWAPQVNGVIKSIAASPDGTRIYIGGTFTQVNGATRYNFAALDATTGALVAGFSPSVGGSGVYGITTVGSTVYVGGSFTQANGLARKNLAAFATGNGALLPWAPTTDLQVDAMVMEPGNQKVILGGRFYTVNGVGGEQRGIAALDPATGATVPWAVTGIIKNGWAQGSTAGKTGIFTLATDATGVYGTGWTYADVASGNIEGTFAVDAGAGNLRWLADCHGDHYGVFSTGKVVYSTSHTHQCDTVNLWPEQPVRQYRYIEAYTADARGTLSRTPSESNIYKNWAGTPSPSAYAWYPDFTVGNASGLGQAGLSITGTGDYISVAGEFGSVNNGRFQGLVRFSTKPSTGAKQGPRVATANWTPTATSTNAGEVRVKIPSNWDRDDLNLTYELRRDGSTTPVATVSGASTWWNQPALLFKDPTVTPGQSYTYRVVAKDADGNSVTSSPVTVTASSTPVSAYAKSVLDGGATHYWPLSEASGTTAADWAGATDLNVNGATRGLTGQDQTTASSATGFAGNDGSYAATTSQEVGPNTFSVEAWFNTTSTSGGKIVGFGGNSSGTSGSYDRHIYLSNSGRLTFGVYPNSVQVIQSGDGYNDGKWHQVVGTLSGNGMAFYVDGQLIGTKSGVTSGQDYSGYWRVGGDNTGGWPDSGSSAYAAATIADVAVYPTPLTAEQIASRFLLSGHGEAPPAAPADAYGKAVYGLDPAFYWRLDETSGSVAKDSGPGITRNTGTYRGGNVQGEAGALNGGIGTSIRTTPNWQAGVTSDKLVVNPTTYSLETWFKTTSTDGGKIIGFGDRNVGESGNYDRHVYMSGDGRVKYGVWTGFANVIESNAGYNDGRWHHVVASQGSAGMALYLDGQLIGTNGQTNAQDYSGYWRIGGDSGWEGSTYWTGSIDETAVYNTAISAADVLSHYRLGSGQQAPNTAPKDLAFTSPATGLSVAFSATASDAEGDALTYAWDFGDSTTATGSETTHAFAAAGTYSVKLTVTDARGASTDLVKDVTVVHASPAASFTKVVDKLKVTADASASTASDGATLSYSWNWGDGSATTQGATSDHTYANSGTFTILLTATDSLGAVSQTSQNVTVTHASPVPSFTKTVDKLKVSVDASASTASDGATLAYEWNWGDGSAVTQGATSDHTYANGGTFAVKLTVTDSLGASSQMTQNVTVTHANPVASFTKTADKLKVSVDASASTASDGATLAYEWTWGDGSAATQGATSDHTYAAAGTFRVTLKVTDSLGASATTSQDVTVSDPASVAYVAADSFGRTTSNGWGTADIGGAWSFLGGTTSVASVQGGKGVLTLPAGQTRNLALTSTVRDSQSTVSYTLPNAPSTGATYVGLGSRRIGSSFYVVRAWHRDNGSVWLVAQSGSTVITSRTINGLTGAAGDTFQMKTEIVGANPTTIRAKIWKAGSQEPAAWQLETTDSTAGLQAPGAPLLQYAVGGSATAAGVVRFDDLTVRDLGTPAANVPPVAAFTSSAAGLVASVDGSTSSDSDGTIASYTWKWGDGSADSTGATASHTYGAAGSYNVQLTVVDNAGAATSITKSVTVTAPANVAVASDQFERAATGGWGQADAGGPWTISGGSAAAASVANGTGQFSLAAGGTRFAVLSQTAVRDASSTVQFTSNVAPGSGGGYMGVVARYTTSGNYYLVNAWLRQDGTVWLVAQRGTTVVQTAVVSGMTYAAGDTFNLAVEVSGSGTTALKAKLWKAGADAPSTWQLQASDSTADLQGPGAVGIRASRPSSSTSTAVVAFDKLVVNQLG